MKRSISIIITSILLGGLTIYCVYMLSQSSLIVSSELAGKELIVGIALIILYLITWFYTTIGAHRLNKPKLTLTILSLFMILCGGYLIVDTAEHITFLSDITRIVGVYLLIATWTGFIGVSDGSKNTSSARVKNVEIIEV